MIFLLLFQYNCFFHWYEVEYAWVSSLIPLRTLYLKDILLNRINLCTNWRFSDFKIIALGNICTQEKTIIKFLLLLQPRPSFSLGSVFPAGSSWANRCISLPKHLLIARVFSFCGIFCISLRFLVILLDFLHFVGLCGTLCIQLTKFSTAVGFLTFLKVLSVFLCQNPS